MSRARIAAWAALGLVLATGGCAPHRLAPPEFVSPALRSRFESLAAARRDAARAVDADLALWLATTSGDRLPALEGRLALAAPDAARLRVASLFGTALDIGARGDTVAAFVPSRLVGLELDAFADSLGLTAPGRLAFRAWSGLWSPPDSAWVAPSGIESLSVVRWREGPDSLALALASSGLPAWVEVWRPGRPPWRATYLQWMSVEHVAWPALLEFTDGEGRFRLTCRTDLARFVTADDRDRVTVRIPEQAQRWTLGDLRAALVRLVGP